MEEHSVVGFQTPACIACAFMLASLFVATPSVAFVLGLGIVDWQSEAAPRPASNTGGCSLMEQSIPMEPPKNNKTGAQSAPF